ncbi:hypothetical protein Taro_017037 [Colocasia esculenta]|uniref:Uncharacterized protein n=1 Tax=Colocasia esculenta TaxID=4460 RepID=A0A843UQD7_COLES|nr:hypothetical protein [Colocasia esculenta]
MQRLWIQMQRMTRRLRWIHPDCPIAPPMTTSGSSSDAGGDGGGNGGGGGGDGGQGGGDGDSGQGGGGGGGGMAFTEEQFFRGATQDTSHGALMQYNRRQKFRPGGHGGGSPVDSHSYDTMISDFERMSTQESVGSYGGHSYHPESISTDYSSGYGPYSGYIATASYLGPSPYMYPPAFSVPVLDFQFKFLLLWRMYRWHN